VYDRAEMPGRNPRTARILAVLSETFWLLVLGVVAMFAFFVALGAVKPADVAGLTIAVLVLAVLWFAHAAWVSRHRTGRDPAAVRARERRGF
jgi:cation transporter-like permease